MARRRAFLLAVVAIAPFLLAASDPVGDISACRPAATGPGDPPDLIRGVGTVVEEGSSAEWRLRFADPLVVPDRVGHPFRVDILIHDPTAPAMDVAYYHDLNRIVRYDAVPEQGVVILLLPERAQNVFLGGTVQGDTLTIQVPGRQITRDLDLEGVPIQDLTWTAVVRDGHRCDMLGSFTPHLPMVGPGVVASVATPSAPASPSSAAPTAAPSDGTSVGGWLGTRWWIAVLAVFLVLALAMWRFAGALRFRGEHRPPDPR
jgi:hypothetical protein